MGSIIIKDKKIIRLTAGIFLLAGIVLLTSISSLYIFYHEYIAHQTGQLRHDVTVIQKALNVLAIEIEQFQKNPSKDISELLKTYKKTVGLINLSEHDRVNSVFLIDHNNKIIEISDMHQHFLSDEDIQHVSNLTEPWGIYQKGTQLFLLRKIDENPQIKILLFSIKPIVATFTLKQNFDKESFRLLERYDINFPGGFYKFISSSNSSPPIYMMIYLSTIFFLISLLLIITLMRINKKKILILDSEIKNQNNELDKIYKHKFLLRESLEDHRKSLLINHIRLLQTSKILCEINSSDVNFPEIQKLKEHTIYDAINNESKTIKEIIEETKKFFINDIEENHIKITIEYDNKKPSLIESQKTIIHSIIFIVMNDHFSKLEDRGFLEIHLQRKSNRLNFTIISNGVGSEGNLIKELSKQIDCLDFKIKGNSSNGIRYTDLSFPVSKYQLNNSSKNKKIESEDTNVVNLFK